MTARLPRNQQGNILGRQLQGPTDRNGDRAGVHKGKVSKTEGDKARKRKKIGVDDMGVELTSPPPSLEPGFARHASCHRGRRQTTNLSNIFVEIGNLAGMMVADVQLTKYRYESFKTEDIAIYK